MQSTSNTYQSIISADGHWFETKLLINGVTYDNTKLVSISTSHAMFSGTPVIGKAVAGEIDAALLVPSADIPTMAELKPYVRVCNASSQSEWLPQGVYYIDTRSETKNEHGANVLTIHGFDAMLKTEQMFESANITGDSVDTDMVDEIASIIGVTVDSRTYTIMTEAYTIPLPTGYTLREVLGYIASMYVGCFVMTDEGKLRLVSILELPAETNYLIDELGNSITFGGDRILV